jgi:TonB family protein
MEGFGPLMPDQTILLIDFDPDSIEAALRLLTEAGWGVEVANDGIAGMEAYERLQPDLVLIEPMVPKKHGFEVCRDIKSSAHGKKTPVLITTGFYCGKKHHLQAKQQYGCDDYLEKPVSGEALVSACRRFLEGSSELEVNDSFKEMGSEDRVPALDDLTEEEIVAHLDALIVEQPAPSKPAEPAESVDAAEFFPDIEKVQPEPELTPAPSVEAEPQRSGSLRWLLLAAVLVIAVGAGLYFVFFSRAGASGVTAVEPSPPPAQPAEPPVVEAAEPVPEEPIEEVAAAEPPPPVKAAAPKPARAYIEPKITIDTTPLPENAGFGLSVGALPETEQTLAEPEPPEFLRGDLLDMAEVDTPPVSIDKPMPSYHPMARQLRQQGTVVLRLLIDIEGRVERVETITNDAGRMLEQTALEKARTWTYRPAMKDGIEVKVWKIEQVVFTLDAR